VGEQSFVLRQPLNDTQLWVLEINSDGFKQGSVGVYYQDDSCLGTPYLNAARNSQLVIPGVPVGDQVYYSVDVGQPMTINSEKLLPGGSCSSFPSSIIAAPMLTRPLSDFTQTGGGSDFQLPFVLHRY
jgi:hypothetical protein